MHLRDSSIVCEIVTPFPAARPSAFITKGYLDFLIKNSASFFLVNMPNFAVGILYFLQSFFVKILDPSS